MNEVTFDLPFPPTVNTYWRAVGGRVLLSAKGRSYREDVVTLLRFARVKPFDGPVSVSVVFAPPDRRRRDLDNLPKGLLDALKYAGVYGDDSQVHRLELSWGEVVKGGGAAVKVSTLGVR